MGDNLGFLGFFDLDGTLTGLFQSRNASRVPTAADSLPTYRVYGPAGLLSSGTTSAFDSGNVTGLYQASVSLAASSGYERGQVYTIRFQATVSSVVYAGCGTFVVK